MKVTAGDNEKKNSRKYFALLGLALTVTCFTKLTAGPMLGDDGLLGKIGAVSTAEGCPLSCTAGNITPCTHQALAYNLSSAINQGHQALAYNLFSASNQGHFLLDDLLNLLIYKPEKVCNVKHAKILGILDYKPREISSKPCEEGGFLYYGYYQTQTLNFQVKNRVRLARYTDEDLKYLWTYLDKSVSKACPIARGQHKGVLHIRRERKFGRSVPDHAVVPAGADTMFIDVDDKTTLEFLCHVVQYDVVVVPWGSELALPVVLGLPVIALVNNFTDVFYHDAIRLRPVAMRTLYMSNSRPKKTHHNNQYFNDFTPTAGQLDELGLAIAAALAKNNDPAFEWPPRNPDPIHKHTGGHMGLIGAVRESRAKYLKGSDH